MNWDDPPRTDADIEDEREEKGGEGEQQREPGEGAGPAEDLQEDPAYNPQGPERKYKGG